MLTVLLVPGALAGSLFVAVDPETLIDVDRSGNWGRLFPAAEGWDFFFASGGDYQHVPLDDAFVPDLARLTRLTGRADLVDHAITRCPDGTWLHVASSTVNLLDDSATAFRYDAALALTASAALYTAEPQQVHRDMPVVCVEGFSATGFFDPDNYVSFRLVELGADAAAVRVVEPEDAPIVTGSSLFSDGATVGIASFRGNAGDLLHVTEYSLPDLAVVDRHLQNVSVAGETAYWSQGLARVGNRYVLAHMARDPDAGFAAQDGDLWLSVFNLDWRRLEQIQLSHNTPPNGGMQPWLALRDDTLVVTYTRELQTYVYAVTVDRVEAGLDPAPEDTAAPVDTSTDTATDTSGDDTAAPVEAPDPGSTCGCGGSAAWLLATLSLVRRRR
ncbi:MAG: hypothetical protein Q8P41_08575 [Pseudomonadota bacterium]|nr:hypothetical protein [Pseudomonadota bacterium]